MKLIGELKRRNVIRVAVFYLISSWLILQVAELLFEALALPDWTLRLVLGLLVLGFPLAVVFSWVYEMTPEGLRREKDIPPEASITQHTARKLDMAVIVVVLLGVFVVIADRWLGSPPAERETVAGSAEPAEAIASATGADSQANGQAAAPASGKAKVDESGPRDPSVAVLPFTTRSSESDDVFFADGIHDDLLTQLAKISALKVISRTSVMEYRDTLKKIPAIAEELQVATVVEGAVQRAGNRVRITAQLIEASSDQHIWAETFDRELTVENLFDIQTEIATAIARALQAALTATERKQLGRVLTKNLEAWEAYRRALRLLDDVSLEAYEGAEAEARRALELDPEFAAAYGIIARYHLALYWFFDGGDEARKAAWAAIQAGRAIDPESPELEVAEAYYHYWGFLAYDKALAALDRALAAIPNDSNLYKVKGFTLRRAGRFEEAIAQLERAHALDPRNPLAATTIAETLTMLGHYEEARRWLDRGSQGAPNARWPAVWRGRLAIQAGVDFERGIHALSLSGTTNLASVYWNWFAHLASGRYEEAMALANFERHSESRGSLYLPEAIGGLTRHVQGNAGEAEPLLADARERLEQRLETDAALHKVFSALCLVTGAQGATEAAGDYCQRSLDTAPIDAFSINEIRLQVAEGLAMAGLAERALAVLETTLDNPARVRSSVLRADPMLRNLRNHPRFEPLLEQINQVEPRP